MEAKWDLTFACDIESINDYIRSQKIPFLKSFYYALGEFIFSGKILTWSLKWADNEIYMGIEMFLTDVTIKCDEYSETYPKIKSSVNIQFAFTENEPNKLKFICREEAKSFQDTTIGAIWVNENDVESAITNPIFANAYRKLLTGMLIENEKNIEFILAELDKSLLNIENLPIKFSVPSFQNLKTKVVIAMLCMTEEVKALPAYQFDTSLLQGFSCGYILKREVFMKHILFPYISNNIGFKAGKLQFASDGSIFNSGIITLLTVRAGAIDYDVMSDFFKIQFIGDVLDLSINGTCPIKGLTDAYISYTFHAKRKGVFKMVEGFPLVCFEKIEGQDDEFHSGIHIPDWEKILSGVLTFGLLELIADLIADTITSKMKNFLKNMNLNGKMGGYGVKWSKQDSNFTSGGFQTNLFMRK